MLLVLWRELPCAGCSASLWVFHIQGEPMHLLELIGIPRAVFKRHYLLKSFNPAHGDGVLLLAFFCWWHCFLTVLVAVAGLLSFLSLSLSFPLDLWAQQTHVRNWTHAEPLGKQNPGALWQGNGANLGHSLQGESMGCASPFPVPLEGLLWNSQHWKEKARQTK